MNFRLTAVDIGTVGRCIRYLGDLFQDTAKVDLCIGWGLVYSCAVLLNSGKCASLCCQIFIHNPGDVGAYCLEFILQTRLLDRDSGNECTLV